jgi:hypothetical protein
MPGAEAKHSLLRRTPDSAEHSVVGRGQALKRGRVAPWLNFSGIRRPMMKHAIILGSVPFVKLFEGAKPKIARAEIIPQVGGTVWRRCIAPKRCADSLELPQTAAILAPSAAMEGKYRRDWMAAWPRS